MVALSERESRWFANSVWPVAKLDDSLGFKKCWKIGKKDNFSDPTEKKGLCFYEFPAVKIGKSAKMKIQILIPRSEMGFRAWYSQDPCFWTYDSLKAMVWSIILGVSSIIWNGPPNKLSYSWKINKFNGTYIYKWWIFQPDMSVYQWVFS